MRFYLLRSFSHKFRQAFSTPLSQRVARVCALLLLLTLAACGGSSENVAASEAPIATAVVIATQAPPATPTEVAATESVSAPTVATPAAASAQVEAAPQLFQIDPQQSEARFIVDEVLFGNPNTVTGVTNEVSGEIAIDLANPPETTVSVIQIDARTLVTDNRFRNRSINRLILQSNQDQYQFITFTPTTIEGLPAAVSVGDTFSFQINGDLKIRDIVQPTIFDVTVTADSATQINGLAATTVLRADFELSIPNVEGVADVTEEVRLELEFVATASE